MDQSAPADDRGRLRVRAAAAVGAVAAGLLVATTLVGTAGASPPPAVRTARVASLGTVLVTPKQLVLYEYGADTKNTSTCTGACAKAWPPYLLAAGVTSVHGPHQLHGLGTIHRGHRLQVTVHGHPLYTFSGQHGADQANGQGLDDSWFVVGPSGQAVHTKLAALAPPPTTTATTGATATTSPSLTPSTPAATSPPVTSPPVSSPPATSPPVTSPPVTSPPVTSPPVTSPPGGGGGGYGY